MIHYTNNIFIHCNPTILNSVNSKFLLCHFELVDYVRAQTETYCILNELVLVCDDIAAELSDV